MQIEGARRAILASLFEKKTIFTFLTPCTPFLRISRIETRKINSKKRQKIQREKLWNFRIVGIKINFL